MIKMDGMNGMDWYSVRMEARAPDDAPEPADYESAADGLMESLEKDDGVVSAGTRSWAVIVSVAARSPLEAAFFVFSMIVDMAAKADMPEWPIVRTEVTRQDLLEAENERSTLPEIVSAPEAAEILRVSAQRVHELAAGHVGFPEPVYELRTGRLWLRAAIEAFAQRWERKPGRPRKAAAAG